MQPHEAGSTFSLARSLAALAAVTALGAGCGHGHGHVSSSPGGIPVYRESEPNDFVEEADWFGTLYRGDLFVIEGHSHDVSYLPFDPFDGFAFRSASPLFVAFTLFVDDPYADVRVSLYDPALDATVASWYQVGDVVEGELEVLYGGLEFHLVVETLYGDTDYGLEIEAFSLYATSLAPALAAAEEPAAAGLASRSAEAADAADAGVGARYGRRTPVAVEAPAGEERVEALGEWIEIDLGTGELTRRPFLVTTGTVWMGNPGTTDAE